MQELTSLYLPETIAQYTEFRQLLLFVDSIIQYLPSEECEQGQEPLVGAGLVQQYAPVPFADELDTFNRLVKDIQGHGNDFYGSYLSSLSYSTDVDEASVRSLIQQMGSNEAEAESNSKKDTLLHARLLLKLAQVQALDEQAIMEKMAGIRARKEEFLNTLKGDEDSVELFQDLLDFAPDKESSDRFKKRLNAWTHLLLADSKRYPWLAVTGQEEAVDLLREYGGSGEIFGNEQKVFSLSVPDFTAENLDTESYLASRNQFIEEAAESRADLHALLRVMAEEGKKPAPDVLNKAQNSWQDALTKFSLPSNAALEFYYFNLPLADLLARTCGLKYEAKQDSVPNCVVGLLRQNPL